MGLDPSLDLFEGIVAATTPDAGRLNQAGVAQRVLRSSFDRYHPVLAVKSNVPPLQDISSDYACMCCFLVEIPRKDLHRRYAWKTGTGEANRATILFTLTIPVHSPDWEFRIRERKIASLGKHPIDNREW